MTNKRSSLAGLLGDTAKRASSYREGLGDRAVAPTEESVRNAAAFNTTLPDEGSADSEIIDQLDAIGSPATMAMAGPRFFGFVIGGSLPAALAANWLATAWDQNVSMHEVTPATSILEQVAMEWLKELLGLPSESAAAFVTGATVANFCALAAARHRVLAKVGWNVEADGLSGAPPVTIIVGDEAHPTLMKSLGLLGFGRNRVTRVPVDGQGRMRPEKLPAFSGPTIICSQVGNVNTGACDPVGDVCDASAGNAWVHVDGAFGLWAAASPVFAHLTHGVESADSWATDAHKWLNVPYDCGIAFVRDQDALRGAMAITAEYLMTDTPHRNPSDFTPELSRRARGVDVWAALRSLGRNGVADLVERCCDLAKRFERSLLTAGYDILNEVVLNQVLVSFGSAEKTRRVIEELQREGVCWCGITVWQGQTAMRISVSNWSTSEADVDLSVAAMDRIAREL